MDTNTQLRIRQATLDAVDKPLRNNDPPETKETYDRLVSQGYSDKEARDLIGSAVSTETFMILKNKEPFNHPRFVASLRMLPKMISTH